MIYMKVTDALEPLQPDELLRFDNLADAVTHVIRHNISNYTISDMAFEEYPLDDYDHIVYGKNMELVVYDWIHPLDK
jgi:hypothetical protein